jgi:hypothetical protein
MALEFPQRVHAATHSETRVSTAARQVGLAVGVGGLCVAVIHVSALANGYYQIYYGRFGWGLPEVAFLLHYLLFGSIAAGCLAWAVSVSVGDGLSRTFDRLGTLSRHVTLALVGASAVVTFGAVTLARYGLLRDTAMTDDENAYAFMARVFASGRLYLPSMPADIRPFFDNQFIINDGKWYGMYFPGHPLVLALGALFGAERWVPSLVVAATVAMAFVVARRIFGTRAAMIAVLLFPVTLYLVLPSASLLAHSTAALALLIFVYGAVRIGADPASIGWWILAGAGLSWAGLTRPLGPIAFAIPWITGMILSVVRSRRPRAWVGLAVFCVIGLGTGILFCGYNYVLTGDPFETGYQRLVALNHHALLAGRLPASWPLPTIYEIGHAVLRLNFWEFGWPLSLLFVSFFRRTGASVRLAAGTFAIPLAYALLGMTNVYALGPTHYAEIAVFVAMLSASGLEEMVERVRKWPTGDRWSRFVLTIPIGSVLCMLLVFLPIHAASLREMSLIARAPYDLVEDAGLDRAVVFVASLPALQVFPGAWVYFHRNPRPDLQDPVLFVRDLGPSRDARLMETLPDRRGYVMGMREGKLILGPLQP